MVAITAPVVLAGLLLLGAFAARNKPTPELPGEVVLAESATPDPSPSPAATAVSIPATPILYANIGLSPAFAQLLAELQAEVDAYSQAKGGVSVAIAVTDLQIGETIAVNGDELHRSGCTINLFALLAATERFQAGVADPNDFAYSVRVGIGSSYPPEVKHFIQSIFGSQAEGAAYGQALMRGWGMETSVFDHVPYYGERDTNNYLTALETNLALVQLHRRQLLSPEWTDYALEVLTDIDPDLNYMLPRYLPWDASVAHKIGYHWDSDGWVNNDAGIVSFTGEDGLRKTYVISYLSQQAPTERIGNWLAGRLSGMVWDYFAGTYGAHPSLEPLPAPYYAS